MTMKRLCATALLLLWSVCAFAVEKSGTIVYINGSKFYIHTVQPGETLYGLSKTYDVGEKVILQYNPSVGEGLRAGENIKVPFVTDVPQPKSERKLRKTFDTHTVMQGETLYGISRKYEIPIQTVVEDNPNLDPTHLRLGERILIRKKEIGSEDEAGSREQWEAYRNSLNSVAEEGYAYHIVHPGETFYSLSRRFGITEEQLGALNGGLKAADLKAGAIIKVPGSAEQLAAAENRNGADTVRQDSIPDVFPVTKVAEVEFRALRRSATLNVALLLPMAVGSDTNANYLEFYQGFLLGLDSVKTKYGCSVHVDLYNTARSPERIRAITESDEFRKAGLIVGPVYEEGLYPVIRYAEEHDIPVVSPLANIAEMNSDVLFQMAPDPSRKWEKIADLVNGDRQVTLIYTDSTDKDFEAEVLALLGDSDYRKYTYQYVHPSKHSANNPGDLTPLLDNGSDNVFIVMADDEVDVERILAAIASADTGITSRGRTAPRFVVLGNTRWMRGSRYNNLDRSIFFKDRVVFISSYHAKRDSRAILDFDSAYIRAFGSLPTLFSYRGYDTALVFCPAMYGDIEYDLEGRSYTPLQTPYVFGQGEGRYNHVNRNWVRVNYNSDFTITIE
ncbi:PBP1 and LysM peptidoglycan-binding domain-containing protein [Alistipes sp.]|uniref:PBP1 and LysM peptidoglycan-binding domain-containing protein n=1 Tax=Alistipes sp. TaxID=1872444 RepID=UPI003AB7A8CA